MPISFTCPFCGATTNVADQYAGQTGPCARCGKPITVPRPGEPAMGREFQGPSPKRSSLPLVVVILVAALGVLVVCGGILAALLLPAVQAAREAARRAQCANNLKQISLALMNYHDANRCFPPAYIADKDGKPMHSWRVLILPYLEQKPLYDQYKFDEPWDGPNNRRLADLMPTIYACPSSPQLPGKTDYLAVVGPGFAFEGAKPMRMSDLKQGATNVITVVDVAGSATNWMEPRDLNVQDLRGLAGQNLRGNHPAGANAAYADGHVSFLPEPLDVQILQGAGGGPAGVPNPPGYNVEF
ncbi:MAG: DUF1559 family PulG-like putative transporter [Pirellulales bacterium]